MTPHEQADIFGGSVPLDEFELTGHLRALAEAERELGGFISADEAGALIHARRDKHPRDARCHYCGADGQEALIRLRARKPADPPVGPPWACQECGRVNPAGTVFCRACGTAVTDDPEPPVRPSYDPATAEIPY